MNHESDRDEMRDEYDIRGGVRGKYYERYMASRLSVSGPAGIFIEASSSTSSVGVHRTESTIGLIAQAFYQPLSPATRSLEPGTR
jgi:hypothetical protein